MNKENKFPYNLQFFADGEENTGEKVPENAEPDVEEETHGDSSEETPVEEKSEGDSSEQDVSDGEETPNEDSDTQDSEENSKYAAARRNAEDHFKKQLAKRDEEYARRFGDIENPITHQKIKSEKDYFAALDAQKQVEMQKQLETAGIDPNLLHQAIENDPLVLRANEVLENVKQQETQRMMDEDLKLIQKIDSSITSLEDVFKSENYAQMLDYVEKNHMRLPDAFKLVNFDKLTQKKSAAAKQAAINSARGKGHMVPTGSNSVDESGLVDIPDELLNAFKSGYPDLSPLELKKKYNQTL